MIHRITLTTLLLLALTSTASADKFYFGKKEEAKKVQGNATQFVEGVLLKEENGNYHIRIVGGETIVPKSMVYNIEKDDLTVAKIEATEKGQEAQVAEADTRRRELQAVEASARRDREVKTQESRPEEKALIIEIDFQQLLPGYTFRTYDPVLHRANLSGLRQVIETFLREEVRKAAHRN